MAQTQAVHEFIPHSLVVPASGQGHINACLLLSEALSHLGFHVSFVYFSSEYAKLKQKHGANIPANLRIHILDDDFAPEDVNKPFHATPAMSKNLESLILQLAQQGFPVTCAIVDVMAPWAIPVVRCLSIPCINYWTASAMSYLLMCCYPSLLSEGVFPERGSPTVWKSKTPLMLQLIPGFEPFPSEVYGEMRFADSSTGMVDLILEASSCAKFAERILIQTVLELESDALKALRALGTPVYAIGPLHSYMEDHRDSQDGAIAMKQAKQMNSPQLGEQAACLAWLDTRGASSVIYIAFGSYSSLSLEEIQELAFGLEAIDIPFLWVVTNDALGNRGLAQTLPEGFLQRSSARGMIISWAPQVKVLEHPAVGGFLTHCGWNSTCDSMWAGVPMLCCPRFADQRANSLYVCEMRQVGIELGRTEKGEIARKYVELGIRALMEGEEGLKVRANIQEAKEIARKACKPRGSSYANLQKLYDDMKELCIQMSASSQ